MVQRGGRPHEVSWSDIEPFWVARLICTKVIAVKYSPSYRNAREARSVVRRLTRAQGRRRVRWHHPEPIHRSPRNDLRGPERAEASIRLSAETGSFAKLLIDCEEDRTLRAVLVGLLREAG
jgi:hypothetical protein